MTIAMPYSSNFYDYYVAAMTLAYLEIVQQQLGTVIDKAHEARYVFALESNLHGITLSFDGFSAHLTVHKLLNIIFKSNEN